MTALSPARYAAPSASVVSAAPVCEPADQEAFERVRRRLRADVGEDIYASWFVRLDFDRIDGDLARMSVPTPFLRNWVKDHYTTRIRDLWRVERPAVARVEFFVRSTVLRAASPRTEPRAAVAATGNGAGEPPSRPPVAAADTPSGRTPPPGGTGTGTGTGNGNGSPLDPRYTFATFVAGRSNQMALAAARQIATASRSDGLMFNPFYVHAGVGLGKTHLLQALAAALRAQGDRRVHYVTAERFMLAFAASFKAQTTVVLKEMLHGVDVFLIDDLQFLQGKIMQGEFGHIVNLLLDSGRQIVVAADRSPLDLESLDERVRSRLASGLSVEVGALDDDMRRGILKARIEAARLQQPGFDMPADVADFVVRTVAQTGRDVDGAFNRLLAANRFSGQTLSMDVAEQILRDLVRSPDMRRVKIEEIQRVVSRHYNVSRNDLLSERRTASIVRPRQIAMYLAKVLTHRSLPDIGRRFGGRDHTTVLHAVRKIEDLVTKNTPVAGEVELLRRMLGE
jgi:chromosomal replication initiator protein